MKTKVKFINIDANYCENVTKVTIFAVPTNRYYDYLTAEQINSVEKLLTDFRYKDTVYRGFVVTGIAKCGPEDMYDSVTGLRIAESRAKIKLYNKACKFYRKCFYCIDDNTRYFMSVYNRNNIEYCRKTNHLNKLLNG